MTCSSASTLKAQAAPSLLPISLPTTQGEWQRVRTTFQQMLQMIQAAGGSVGNNVIPQQYALIAGSSLPPISATSNCTVSADTSTPLFGAGGSYKVSITGSPATVTFSPDTAWPLHPGWQWVVSFFQQASANVSGVITVTTPTKSYSTDFTTTLAASGWERLFDTLNLGADTSTSFGLSVTFTGGTGQTVWLDGLMLEPYFNVVLQPSPFMSTSAPLTLDNNPDGTYVKLLGSHASGNVAYNFKGVWSSATGYVTGDEVVYGTSYWLALANSTNSAPSTSNANWQVVGTYSGFLGAWSSVTTYAAGAEVTYSGNYWVCVTGNTNSAPTTSNANWQIAGPTSLDNVADGTTYQRPLATALTAGQVDLSKAGVVNKNLGNIADTGAYKRFGYGSFANRPPAGVLGTIYHAYDSGTNGITYRDTGTAWQQIGVGHLADIMGTQDNITQGASRFWTSAVDANNRALIDFSQAGHLNKSLDNISDGSTYARVRAGALFNGLMAFAPTGKNLLANPGFESNIVGTPLNAVQSGKGTSIGDGWSIAEDDGWTNGQFAAVLSTSYFLGGAQSARIVNDYNGASTFGANAVYGGRVYSNNIPVRAGETLFYGGGARLDTNVAVPSGITVEARIGVIAYEASGTFIAELSQQTYSPNAGWQTLSGTYVVPSNCSYVVFEIAAFIINNNGVAVTLPSAGTINDSSFDDVFLFVQVGLDNEAYDGTNFVRMNAPPAVSAGVSTSLGQSGTTTTINVGAGTYYLGNITVNANSGSVNPGAYGTYYVYFDNPGWGGGAVTYQASTDPLIQTQAPFRIVVGKITTVSGGGGGGGGINPCFSGDTRILTPSGYVRFDELPERFELVNRTGRHWAMLLVHPDSTEPMRRMGPHLVTASHLIRVGDGWVPAGEIFHERVESRPRTVYNAHVLTDCEADRHYILENGLTAHNIKA